MYRWSLRYHLLMIAAWGGVCFYCGWQWLTASRDHWESAEHRVDWGKELPPHEIPSRIFDSHLSAVAKAKGRAEEIGAFCLLFTGLLCCYVATTIRDIDGRFKQYEERIRRLEEQAERRNQTGTTVGPGQHVITKGL